ncbi:MAG: response regulator [Pseudomonadota bacterium]
MSYKILLVDDYEDIREIVQDVAESFFKENEKPEFFQVSNGLEALNSCFKQQYDLIFCDIKMPQMDGLSFLRSLRKSQSMNSETFVIMVTGYIGVIHADMDQGLENTYLVEKPFSDKSVINAMNIWMGIKLRSSKEKSS